VSDRPALRGACILLLEDDALISIDAEDMLRTIGARQVLVAHTLEAAADLVGCEAIDGAVLDVMIGRGRSDALARLLTDRRVPVVFASGCGEMSVPEDLRHIPKVEKPYSGEALRTAFAAAGRAQP
jgi:DNA-binding response OmpR family regulator